MRKKRMPLGYHVILSLIFIIVLLVSFKFDSIIVDYVTRLRNPWLNSFMLWVTYLGSTLVVLFILTSLFLWHEHKRRWILPLWLSLAFSAAVSFIIKLIIARPRPYQLGFTDTLPILAATIAAWNSSFSSSHAAVAFSALPVLDKEFPYFRFVWFGFACLVAFSRVYFSLHYLSDVLVGALLGYVLGLFFVRLEEKYRYSRILRLKKKW
jgi:undecaprenyl-diphosphatase